MTAEAPAHVHHWLIATPNGPVCPAVCKTCGEARDYPTTVESAWEDTFVFEEPKPERQPLAVTPKVASCKPCLCGCGKLAASGKKYVKRHEPDWPRCQCGCREPVRIWAWRYLSGHSPKARREADKQG